MILTEKDIYQDYIRTYPKDRQTPFSNYFAIITLFIKLIFERIVYHNEVFVFPKIQFGFLGIIKKIPESYYRMMNLKNKTTLSKANKSLIATCSNIDTNGYSFVTQWDKRLSYCKVYRTRYYRFIWNIQFKQLMKTYIRKCANDSNLISVDAPLKRI